MSKKEGVVYVSLHKYINTYLQVEQFSQSTGWTVAEDTDT